MPTVRQLLDRYGQPPAEVALDWAWQIRRRVTNDENCLEDREASCLLEMNEWTQLEVSDDGRLACEQLQPAVAAVALDDLRLWAGKEQLDQLISARPDAPTTSEQIALTPPSQQSETPSSGAATGSPTAIRFIKSNQSIKAKSRGLRRAWLAGSCIALGVIVLLALYRNDSKRPTQPDNVAMNSQAPSDESPLLKEAGHLDSSTISELDTQSLASSVANMPTADYSLPDVVGHMTLGQLSVAPSLDPNSAIFEPSTGSSPTTNVAETNASSLQEDAVTKSDSGSVATVEDGVVEVERTLKKAEAAEAVAMVGGSDGSSQDRAGKPWVLLRDTLRYRVTAPPKLNMTRQSQWTLSIEPIAGLVIEPAEPVTLAAPGSATWRIVEPDAKAPRACLLVRAQTRGRDGDIELLFCGGSEDMPYLSVPLAERWLDPLSTNVQNQAVQLRAALAQLSRSVITPEQAPIVLQRKQLMMAQMVASLRLVAILPDIARLAQLADGQITMHAELRSKAGEPPIATWGQISR